MLLSMSMLEFFTSDDDGDSDMFALGLYFVHTLASQLFYIFSLVFVFGVFFRTASLERHTRMYVANCYVCRRRRSHTPIRALKTCCCCSSKYYGNVPKKHTNVSRCRPICFSSFIMILLCVADSPRSPKKQQLNLDPK